MINSQAKKKKRDNRGFSLIETVLGVLILGIIVTPLLHAILTSANLTSKTRRYRSDTDAAQNVVETILSDGIDRLITEAVTPGSNMSGLVDSIAFYKESEGVYTEITEGELESVGDRDDKYFFGLKGLKTPQGEYDAMVALDATVYNANVNAVSIYTQMDGVFSQPSSPDENPDLLAAAYFSDQATVFSGEEINIDYFLGTMNREIRIILEKIPDGVGFDTGVIIGTVEFTYTSVFEGEVFLSTYDTEFFRAVYEGNDDGVDSIFFFYYPNYNTTDAVDEGRDNVVICNDDDIEFSIFLVKQRYADYTQDELLASELRYPSKLKLTLYEPDRKIARQQPHCSVYSNLNTNLVVGGDIMPGKTYDYQVRNYNEVTEDWNYWSLTPYAIPNKLVYSKPVNRMYAVTVDLYKAGTGFADDSKILTFESSQIE